jgi:integrase
MDKRIKVGDINKQTVGNDNNKIIWEIYYQIMNQFNEEDYPSLRIRLAIFLLTVTHSRISELLPLRVECLQILEKTFFIKIGNQTLFIENPKLRQLIFDRKKDIKNLSRIKNENDFIFTSHFNLHSASPLRRESLTRLVNSGLKFVVRNSEFPKTLKLTTESFRQYKMDKEKN